MQFINSILYYFPKWSVSDYLLFFGAFLILLALFLNAAKKKKISYIRAVACALLPAFLFFVYSTAVLTRSVQENPEHYFRLFWSYDKAWETWGWSIRKEILVNILIFVPAGLLFPVVLNKRSLWRTLLCGFSFSALIEISQLVTSRGSFEFDDMFHNTLGTLLGYLIFAFVYALLHRDDNKPSYELSQPQKTLLAMTSSSLFGTGFKEENETDWSAVLKESIAQAVTVLAFKGFDTKKLPDAVFRDLQSYSRMMAIKSVNVNYGHAEAHKLFSENKIPYVILKGCASSYYYPEPSLRAMGDVDILVREEDMNRVGEMLTPLGFTPKENNENEKHLAYYRRIAGLSSCWEVHWQPPGIPYGKEGEVINGLLKDIISKGVLVKTSEGEFIMPCEFHHGLVLLLHTASHLINSGIGLRHLCDWAVFVNSFGSERFTEVFRDKLKKAGLWRFAVILTRLCEKYLGLPRKDWAQERVSDTLLEKMMLDILSGGNFGQKDRERLNQSKLITNGETKSVGDGSMTKQLALSLKEKAFRAFPTCEKHRILIPIGMLYVASRHILRIKKGTRPEIHLTTMVKGAGERKSIYKEFHLFK